VHEEPALVRVRPPGPVALAALIVLACGPSPPPVVLDAARPPIVLVTLDTTRRDHLGCYGYARDTSPNFDRLCRSAQRFDRAYSTTSWTLPAHASLFTGLYTDSHGARYDADGPLVLGDAIDERAARRYRARGLDPRIPTLAGALGGDGYTSGGFVAGPWMKRIFGLDRGFDHWDDAGIDHENGRRAEALTDAALAWLREHAAEPFLLFVNYYDPHSPYSPPAAWRGRFASSGESLPGPGESMTVEQARQLYDAEIAYMDDQLGRLLDALRDWGLYDAAWIVVTADHGDVIGEHGTAGHGCYLWEEEIRIPLVVKAPGEVVASVDDAAVQLNDLAPMLLAALGRAPLAGAGGPRERGDERVLAELYPLPFMFARGDWRALVEWPYKYVWNSKSKHRLHDLESPAGEDENRIGREPLRARRMQADLDALLARLPAPPVPGTGAGVEVVDEATRRALEGLGYLEDHDGGAAGERNAPQ